MQGMTSLEPFIVYKDIEVAKLQAHRGFQGNRESGIEKCRGRRCPEVFRAASPSLCGIGILGWRYRIRGQEPQVFVVRHFACAELVEGCVTAVKLDALWNCSLSDFRPEYRLY